MVVVVVAKVLIISCKTAQQLLLPSSSVRSISGVQPAAKNGNNDEHEKRNVGRLQFMFKLRFPGEN